MDELPQIAIFGGTFDPIHRGHLTAARDVRNALECDEFRFLPAGQPPHRQGTVATAGQRLTMLEIALQNERWCSIDPREINRHGPSWMVTTLESLRTDYPQHSLCLIVGQDSANTLDSWHEWRQILQLAHLVIMTRPGESAHYSAGLAAVIEPRMANSPACLKNRASGLVLAIPVTPVEVSSTQVRASIASQTSLKLLLPPAVARYIHQHGLYR